MGFVRTHSSLCEEANFKENYEICDNIDLDTIYLDFCSYYQLKFGKQPKIVKRIEQKNVSVHVQPSNANKSMKVKRRIGENETNKEMNTTDNTLLNSTITVSSLSHPNNSNSSLQSNNNNDYVNSTASNELPPVDYKYPFRDYEYYNSDMKEMADIISRWISFNYTHFLLFNFVIYWF